MDPNVDQLTAELVRLYAATSTKPLEADNVDEHLVTPSPHEIQQLQLPDQSLILTQTSVDSGGRCEDALDDLVRELHAENLQLRRRLRSSEAEHGHRVRCLVDTLDRMQKEVAEMATRKSAAVKRPKSDCTDQASASSATTCCCQGNAGQARFRRRSISIGEDARELASVLTYACQELRAENSCLMQQLRQMRSRTPAVRTSQRRRDLRRCQAEEELVEVREELHRLRVSVLEASVRFPGLEALLLKP